MTDGCGNYFINCEVFFFAGEKVSGAGMGNGLAGLAYFASNDSDPYITLKKTVSTFEYIAHCS